MVIDKGKKRSPPYVSYRTFHNLLEFLNEEMPARIDRSFWEQRFSGSTGIQLVAALRFLNLVDANSIPTEQLKILVTSKNPQRAELLRKITTESFVFLSGNRLDPKQATYDQLKETFHELYQVDGEVARKCIKFFTEISTAADIPLSTFISKKSRTGHVGAKTKRGTKNSVAKTERNSMIPNGDAIIPPQTSRNILLELLLSKFPQFDPAWPNDVQMKWFTAFNDMLNNPSVSGDGK